MAKGIGFACPDCKIEVGVTHLVKVDEKADPPVVILVGTCKGCRQQLRFPLVSALSNMGITAFLLAANSEGNGKIQ